MFSKKLQPKKLRSLFVFLLILVWVFSGVPQIWDGLPFPSKIEMANALSVSQGDGIIFYGLSVNTTPQWRTYNAATNTFGAPAGTVIGTQPIIVQTKTSPTKQEAIAAYQDAAGILQVMCYDGTSWTNEWTATVAPSGTPTTRRFDIAYETNSGDVMVLYSTNAAPTDELAYRTKSGAAGCGAANWATALNRNVGNTSGIVQWVKMSRDPRSTSNLIAATWLDISGTNPDLAAMIWDGSAWVNESVILETTMEVAGGSATVDAFDIAHESLSGNVMVVWSESGGGSTGLLEYARCTGGTPSCTWSAVGDIPTVADAGTSVDLSANPLTNQMAMAAIDNTQTNNADMSAAYWNGTAWTGYRETSLDDTCERPDGGMKLVQTGWLTNGATTRWVITYDDSTGSGLSWFAATPGIAPVRQADQVVTPLINDLRQRYDLEVDPFNRDRLMLTLSDSGSPIYAKRLTMDSAGNFTWTDADGGASLGTTNNVPQQGFTFRYWQFIPPANSITVGATLSQPLRVAEGSTDVMVGAFTFITSSGPATITSITINEEGSVNANANLSNVQLFAQQETPCTFAGSTQIGTTQTFNASDQVVFGSLSLAVDNVTQQCVFVEFNVGTAAGPTNTIEIEISFSSDIVATGAVVMGSFPVQISNTTTIGADQGTIMSTPVDFDWVLPAPPSWGQVVWATTETEGDVKLRVYYKVTADCDTIVPDAALTGNSAGFDVTQSPLNISGLTPVATTYNRLCLQATLTPGATASPTLNDWKVTWQAVAGAIELSAYKFFNNLDGPDVGTELITATLPTNGQKFRLRFLIHAGTAPISAGTAFKLQFREKGAACDMSGTYGDITNSTAIAYTNNVPPDDGTFTANANDPIHGADPISIQTYNDSDTDPPGTADTFTNTTIISAGQDGKWDFALIDLSAPSGKIYCTRVIKVSDGQPITHNVIPQITVSTAYALSGNYVSSDFDTGVIPAGRTRAFNVIEWSEALTGACSSCDIRLQINTSPDNISWTNWCGPSDTAVLPATCPGTNYYTIPAGERVSFIVHNGHRYVRYRVDFIGDTVTNGTQTPIVNWVKINYQ